MNLQGYGYGIHNICHKGHDAYIQILLKAAFLKACDVDSESSLTKLQGMLGPLWQVKLPSSSSETRVRAFPALLPIGRAHCASRPTSFCVSVQQICQMDRNPAGSCNLGVILTNLQGFLGGASVKKKKNNKKPACRCRRHRRCGFDPWVGKIPWRRTWQPTPVCLPEESHGERSLACYSPWRHKELDMTEVT